MSKLPPITMKSKNNHCEKKRGRLLELPYEIRASILHLSLQPSSRSIYVGRRERWNLIEGRKVLLGSCPSILTTCRQVYRECLNVLQDKHATFVLHLRKGMHSLPSNLSYRKHVRRLTLAILAKSNRKSRLEIYLPMTLERLTLQMEKTFPNLQHLSLTLCVRSPRVPTRVPKFSCLRLTGLGSAYLLEAQDISSVISANSRLHIRGVPHCSRMSPDRPQRQAWMGEWAAESDMVGLLLRHRII